MNLANYHKWLLKTSHRNRTVLFGIIQSHYNNHNPVVYDLLAETGDRDYTQKTFLKATDLLLNEIKKEDGEETS